MFNVTQRRQERKEADRIELISHLRKKNLFITRFSFLIPESFILSFLAPFAPLRDKFF
jgi:hypothetical protein